MLDALVDAPSSFAASLIFIRQAWGEPAQQLSVDAQLDIVRTAASDGLIELRIDDDVGQLLPASEEDWKRSADEYRRWLADLSEITPSEVSFDPVGLWMALTELGRTFWSSFIPADEMHAPRWHADYDAETQRITAGAESLQLSRKAAADLALRLQLELDVTSE